MAQVEQSVEKQNQKAPYSLCCNGYKVFFRLTLTLYVPYRETIKAMVSRFFHIPAAISPVFKTIRRRIIFPAQKPTLQNFKQKMLTAFANIKILRYVR